jgi:hypothetical protein
MERIDQLIADLPDDNSLKTENQRDVGLESVNHALDFLATYPKFEKRVGVLRGLLKNGLSMGVRDEVRRTLNAIKLDLAEGGRRRKTRRRKTRRRKTGKTT